MKTSPIATLFAALLIAFITISLNSCGGADSAESSKAKHVEPWDYEPTDPALLSGKKIYAVECGLCHNEGEEGAPSLLSTATWKEREAKGMETLLKHAIEGWIGPDGEMPAKGGSDYLSDEQVANAVKFMLSAYKHH